MSEAARCDNHRACSGYADGAFHSSYHEADLWLCALCLGGFRRDFGDGNIRPARGPRR